ncbi:hypothetical protein JQ473_16000, partial [Brucella melitensis]|nr:hypothetical protein [Brucella melitensis]
KKKFADVKTAIEDHRIENVKMFEFLTVTDYADVLKIADVCIASLIKEGVGLGVPSKNYVYPAVKKPLVLIMDKQSVIVQHVEQYDEGIKIDNGDAHAIYKLINTHSSKELHEMGERAHQL